MFRLLVFNFNFFVDVTSGIIRSVWICQSWKLILWINSFVRPVSGVRTLISPYCLPSLIYFQKTLILICVLPTNNDVSTVSYTQILTLPKLVIKLLVAPFRNIVQTHVVSNICSLGLIHGRRRVGGQKNCGRV